MERVKGIEPSCSAWKADVLPLNYTRKTEESHSTNSDAGSIVGRLKKQPYLLNDAPAGLFFQHRVAQIAFPVGVAAHAYGVVNILHRLVITPQ